MFQKGLFKGRRKELIESEDLKTECHSAVTMAPQQISLLLNPVTISESGSNISKEK
jgi:predicted methyltransferase MtxX (methanogen marker protein 4)